MLVGRKSPPIILSQLKPGSMNEPSLAYHYVNKPFTLSHHRYHWTTWVLVSVEPQKNKPSLCKVHRMGCYGSDATVCVHCTLNRKLQLLDFDMGVEAKSGLVGGY